MHNSTRSTTIYAFISWFQSDLMQLLLTLLIVRYGYDVRCFVLVGCMYSMYMLLLLVEVEVEEEAGAEY